MSKQKKQKNKSKTFVVVPKATKATVTSLGKYTLDQRLADERHAKWLIQQELGPAGSSRAGAHGGDKETQKRRQRKENRKIERKENWS
jgi:hypothetical protein